MDLEVVTIGTELLLGFTLDTNSAFLGQALAGTGARVTRRTSVPDDPSAVASAVAEGLARTRFVLTTGGLGPTKDDLTKKAVAELLGLPLEFHPDLWDALTARFARMGRKLAERNRCQAEVPRGAVVLLNPRGTAPGLWIAGDRGDVIMLPGVPGEMQGLVTEEVIPRLEARSRGRVVRSLIIRTTGIPESNLAERMEPVEETLAPLTLAYLPGLEGVDLRLTAWEERSEDAERFLAEAGERVRGVLGDHVYGTGHADLAAAVLEAGRDRGWTVAVAESCTGGMVGERLTAIPGSSDVFLGGMIAYSNRLKEDLGVPLRILEAHGAVSEETASAMATAARGRWGASVAGAVTGIAGPAGGTSEKPVGLVWFAAAIGGEVSTDRWVFPGSRYEIRARATQFALWKLWRKIRSAGPP